MFPNTLLKTNIPARAAFQTYSQGPSKSRKRQQGYNINLMSIQEMWPETKWQTDTGTGVPRTELKLGSTAGVWVKAPGEASQGQFELLAPTEFMESTFATIRIFHCLFFRSST